MEHPARKITKIAREAERVVLLAMRRDDVGTAEIDLIHAVRHHPGITQTELAQALHADRPAIARRTASLERKGYSLHCWRWRLYCFAALWRWRKAPRSRRTA